jgi:hypothetical protein
MAVLCLGLAGMAAAKSKGSKPVKVKALPFLINPAANLASAAWVTHQGLPDAGKSGHALYFQKTAAAPADTLPGASVAGVKGLTLTELGCDYRVDGLTRAVLFEVKDQSANTYQFYLPATPAAYVPGYPDWAEVRFDLGAGIANVDTVTIYFDWGSTPPAQGETDFIYLDNIDVNGALMGKPGNAKVK